MSRCLIAAIAFGPSAKSPVCVQPTALDLLPPFETHFVVILERPEALSDHVARVVVEPALDFPVDELLEFWASMTRSCRRSTDTGS